MHPAHPLNTIPTVPLATCHILRGMTTDRASILGHLELSPLEVSHSWRSRLNSLQGKMIVSSLLQYPIGKAKA